MKIYQCISSIVLATGMILFNNSPAHALDTTWYVSTTGSDSNNCLSSATACRTIQGAIDKAGDGDTIEVAEGTYIEHLTLKPDIKLLGAGPDVTFIKGHDLGGYIIFINSIARDAAGNLVAAGNDSSNAMRIDPEGGIREVLPPEFEGRPSAGCAAVAAGPGGDFFVARLGHDGVFRIQPDGTVTRVLDAAGAGPQAPLFVARGVAVDVQNRVYVAGFGSHNVFRVTPGAQGDAPAAPVR